MSLNAESTIADAQAYLLKHNLTLAIEKASANWGVFLSRNGAGAPPEYCWHGMALTLGAALTEACLQFQSGKKVGK